MWSFSNCSITKMLPAAVTNCSIIPAPVLIVSRVRAVKGFPGFPFNLHDPFSFSRDFYHLNHVHLLIVAFLNAIRISSCVGSYKSRQNTMFYGMAYAVARVFQTSLNSRGENLHNFKGQNQHLCNKFLDFLRAWQKMAVAVLIW